MKFFSLGPITGWLIFAIFMAIVEILTPVFGFVFFSVAALLATGAAALGLPAAIQYLVFSVSVFLLLWLVRPRFAAKLSGARGVPSRADRLSGARGQVTEAIDPVFGTGRVTVAGDDWAARSPSPIPVGAEVIVRSADGIVLQVEVVP